MQMSKKQTIKKPTPLEKLLTLSGIILVIVGCAAGFYSGYVNQRFIYDPSMVFIYFRLLFLLGGGFLIGYALNRKRTKDVALFNGVFYAIFATLVHELLFTLRFALGDTTGELSYPWGKIFFVSIPVATLILTAGLAYFTRRAKHSTLNTPAKHLLIAAFILNQLYMFLRNLDAYVSPESLWPMIVGYILTPFTVAALVYLFLPNIKQTVDRILYAVMIATFYSIIGSVVWEFNSNLPHAASQWFTVTATIFTVGLTSLLAWRVRAATRTQTAPSRRRSRRQ